MWSQPVLTKVFEYNTHSILKENKKLFKSVSPEILEVPENVENIPGMFLWTKLGSQVDFKKSMINTVDGSLFGQPDYVRINLALSNSTLQQVVERLNAR